MAMISLRRTVLRATLVGFAIATGSVAALAHAKLLSVNSVSDNTGNSDGTELRLGFSEGIEPAFSKVTILGSDHNEIAVGDLAVDPADGKVVVLKASNRLSPGHYTVKWSVVSSDGHKAEGSQEYEAK